MSPSPAPEAHEAALAELLGQHEMTVGLISRSWVCSCGERSTNGSMQTNDLTSAAERDTERRAHLASVLLAAGWLPPETVTEARADEPEWVEAMLSEFWIPSPVAPESIAQNELLHEIRSAVRARADSLAPEAPSEEQR